MDVGKVVLFLPPYQGGLIGPPLSLLSVAAPLREAGYEVSIIDGALRPDYAQRIEREIRDCTCLGISVLTGPMIREAVAMAKRAKQLRPDLPVIFGGWHPSLLPAQTLSEPYVDAVVLRQGEMTLLEMVQRIAKRSSFDFVQGCWFKRGGKIVKNTDRPAVPLSKLPRPAYDMVDFDAYHALSGERTLPYATSLGCPYACNYCTDSVYYNRKFHAYAAREVAVEMTELASRYRLWKIALVDSNFLVNVHRAVDIAQGLIDEGARVEWTFQASTDLLCRMSDAEVDLLGRSGVTHIGFGTESASEAVLEYMNKPHQQIADMYEAARKCRHAGIRVTYNLIFGYPGETEEHRRETLRVMSEIGALYPNVSFSPNIFTPYPGIPIWPELRKMGVKEPGSLEEWANIALGTNILPWLDHGVHASVQRSVAYFLLNGAVARASSSARRSPVARAVLRGIASPLKWRMKHHFFRWPVELWLAVARRKLVLRRSLLTGKALSRRLATQG
jgi:radical SAM superfamily enzyme YgiQ (UPF0313 family)